MLIGLRNAEVFLCYSANLFCFLFLIILTLTGQTGWQQAVSYACSRTISSTRKNRYWSKGIEVTEGSQCEGKQVGTLLNACTPIFSFPQLNLAHIHGHGESTPRWCLETKPCGADFMVFAPVFEVNSISPLRPMQRGHIMKMSRSHTSLRLRSGVC